MPENYADFIIMILFLYIFNFIGLSIIDYN